jgi:hypothetical protein
MAEERGWRRSGDGGGAGMAEERGGARGGDPGAHGMVCRRPRGRKGCPRRTSAADRGPSDWMRAGRLRGPGRRNGPGGAGSMLLVDGNRGAISATPVLAATSADNAARGDDRPDRLPAHCQSRRAPEAVIAGARPAVAGRRTDTAVHRTAGLAWITPIRAPLPGSADGARWAGAAPQPLPPPAASASGAGAIPSIGLIPSWAGYRPRPAPRGRPSSSGWRSLAHMAVTLVSSWRITASEVDHSTALRLIRVRTPIHLMARARRPGR